MEQDSRRRYAFGPYRFDAEDRLLTRGGDSVRLTPKSADLLLALLEFPGRVVDKEHLIRQVWPDSFVEDGSLTFQVNQLRHVLGEKKDGPKYIENVPRRGYRFVPPVTILTADVPSSDESSRPNPPTPEVTTTDAPSEPVPAPFQDFRSDRRRLLGWIAGLVVATAAGLAIVGSMGLSSSKPLRIIEWTQLTRDERLKEVGTPLVSDGTRVIFSSGGSQLAVSAANGEAADLEILNEFFVLDASLVRSEFLAIRPRDRGGENALWAVPFNGESPRRLGETLTTDAAWSPDGSRFAYSHDKRLYLADASGTAVRELGSFTGHPAWIRWSPDALRLRFTVRTHSDRTHTQSLWEVRSDGSDLHRLLDGWDQSSRACCGDWMPDGENYIFQVHEPARQELWIAHERKRLFARPHERIIQLSAGPISFLSPIASPDGQRIFVFGMTHAGRLERYDPSTQRFRPYAGDLAAWAVDFSRDGKSLVYVRYPDNTVWRARADGTGRRQLTFAPMEASGCAWSPDETQLACRAKLPGQQDKVYLIPAEGGSPVPIATANVAQGTPSWSPDGMRLAFGDVPEKFATPTGTETIHIYDLRRREMTSLPGSEVLWTSRWSPDGRYMAALTLTNLQELMLFDFATDQWRKLNVSHVSGPTWSRDSKYLYFEVEGGMQDSAIKRVRIADGVVEPIADLRQHLYTWAGLSADGSPMILRKDVPQIHALKVERR